MMTTRGSMAIHASHSTARSVQAAALHRETRLAQRPRRVPRVVGDVLAAQRRVRGLAGDEMAELLEAVVAHPRRVHAVRGDVGGPRRRHPIGDPEKKKNQISKAAAAPTTAMTSDFS